MKHQEPHYCKKTGDFHMREYQLIICIYFIVGLTCFVFSGYLYKKSISTNRWCLCKGEIVHSSVAITTFFEESASYKAKINYKYTVENQTYFSGRIYYGSFLYKFTAYRKEADSLVKKFKVGDIVDIFYDPQNPQKSVLIRGVNSVVYIVFSSGCLVTLIAILSMIYYW